jgi:glycosyltransferase involved in cell wall biosynthesis
MSYLIKRKIMGIPTLRHCDRIIVTSAKNKTLMEIRYHISSDKICLLPYGIDHGLFTPGRDGSIFKKKFNINVDRYILNVGRLEKEKGVDLLLKAYGVVSGKYPDVALVIVGDGSRKKMLDKLSRDIGRGQIIFTGEIKPGEMLASAYSGAELFVLPSQKEPFGIVLLEALASGTPIVASDDGGFAPELIESGTYGTLFSSGNHLDLALKISHMLAHPGDSQQMARSARNHRLENYQWNTIADKIIEIYEQVRNSHSGGKNDRNTL